MNTVISSDSNRIDHKIMSRYPGRIVVKSGANGYFAGGIPEKGIGFAIKTNDGDRPLRDIALVELLHQIGVIPKEDLEYFAPEHMVQHFFWTVLFAASVCVLLLAGRKRNHLI